MRVSTRTVGAARARVATGVLLMALFAGACGSNKKTSDTTVAAASLTRNWKFGKTWDGVYVINGKVYDVNRIDAVPRAGDTEIWEFQTGFGWSHPVHVHLANFKVLDRNGNPPPAHERGFWKETVVLHPNEKVRVLMKWPSVPARPVVSVPAGAGPFTSKYVFHCHNLGHEDHDMMTQFRIT